MNQESYRKLISGQKTGLSATLSRLLLRMAAFFYGLVIRLRNLLYSKGWLKAHEVNSIVFSIGNITVGGTGKTPLVVWLCNTITKNLKLKTKNCRCAILTRGYKTQETKEGGRGTKIDEPAMLAQNCPQAKVIVNPDRVGGAIEAILKFGTSILIMDDGFQHRRLARDLDIVTIDATLPFGYGKMLPAGLLREPVTCLKRADAVVITRCDQISTTELDKLEQKLRQIKHEMVIARSIHDPVCVQSLKTQISLEKLKGEKVFAFSGIGNPNAFLSTIKSIGCTLVGSTIFDDHHYYTQNCISDIYKQARQVNAGMILTTHKDYTKITQLLTDTTEIPLAYLVVEIKFSAGRDKLTDLIENALAGKI